MEQEKFSIVIAGLALCLALLPPFSDAAAHGEKFQPADLRVRSVQWYDTQLSRSSAAINDAVTLKGKFYISTNWPNASPTKPPQAFLHTGATEPTLLRLDTKINGVKQAATASLQLGRHYEYEIALKARVPGRSHVHPVLHVENAGPLIGPGKWIDVTGDFADFNHVVKAMTGTEFDIANTARQTAITWYWVWAAIGLLWLVYLFVTKAPRLQRVSRRRERANRLMARATPILGPAILLATLGLGVANLFWAMGGDPLGNLLQSGDIDAAPLAELPKTVDAKVKSAVYDTPARSLQMQIEVSNRTSVPLRLGEISSSYVRFINPDVVGNVQGDDRDDAIALDGLIVEGGAIAPGETDTLNVMAQDLIWETERLSNLSNISDGQFAALMHFYTPTGDRLLTEITGVIRPAFR